MTYDATPAQAPRPSGHQYLAASAPQTDSAWPVISKPRVSKRWKSQEDDTLERLSELSAESIDWEAIARQLPGRTAKQCKNRWKTRLAPGIRRDAWTPEEDLRLLSLQARFGNLWSVLLTHFPGRCYASLKNRWYGTVRFMKANQPLSEPGSASRNGNSELCPPATP
jgi:hypothetical protein